MAQHTPGPWQLVRHSVTKTKIELNNHPTHSSCTVATLQPEDDNGAAIQMNDANARLIAAAPELLDALEELLECQKFGFNALAKQMDRKGNAKIAARAAIAKAKGNS